MPEILVPLGFFAMVTSLALGVPLVRGLVRRWEGHGQPAAAAPELRQRLERMEHTLDAMALEVERISENQRFTTRLLAERGPVAQHAGEREGARMVGGDRRPS